MLRLVRVVLIFVLLSWRILRISAKRDPNPIESERAMYASRMISYMDQSVDPCDDFYEYACGNYKKVHKMKPATSSLSLYELMDDELQDVLYKILEQPTSVSNPENATVVDKAKYLYQSCMKVNVFDFPKSEYFVEYIKSLGGMPALHPEWKADDFDWNRISSKLAAIAVNPFVRNMIWGGKELTILPGDFGLHSFDDDSIKRPYSREYHINKELIKKILAMYEVNTKNATKVFREVLNFGKKYVQLLRLQKKDGNSVEMDFEELKATLPDFDWNGYLHELIGKPVDLSELEITVHDVNFLKQLPELINRNKKAAANYMFLIFLYNMHDEFEYTQYHQKYCLQTLQGYMYPVVAAMYLNSDYHQESVEDEVMTMSSYMKSALKDVIKSADWMDKQTRNAALNKLHGMTTVIGDVDFTLDLEKWGKYYSDLHLNPNNFYENKILARSFRTKLNFKKLIASEADAYDEDMYSTEVNAYYDPRANKMILPAGILRKPMYYPELPKSYNYGSMGANIIGHEITHGFDNTGRHFDKKGEAETWWTEETDAAYEERASCFVNQYDSYRIPEMNVFVQGNLTLDENIADSGGVRQGYFAYQKWLRANKALIDLSRETLPELNMTNFQLFFLSYAQTYCGEEKWYKSLEYDEHAVLKWRAIGSLANFDQFGKEFNCKLGTTMNPETKCVIW